MLGEAGITNNKAPGTGISRRQLRDQLMIQGAVPCRCKGLKDRLEEVPGHADGGAEPDIAARRARRVEVGAKQAIPHHRGLAEVGIGLRLKGAVMPTMQIRSAQKMVEDAAFDIHVRMGNQSYEDIEGGIPE